MPYIIKGEPNSWSSFEATYSNRNISYKYPDRLDLKPGSEFHNSIRDKIWERARAARNEICKRFSRWREIDRTLTMYMPLKDVEEDLQEEDESKPVSIVFPYSYSMLEALLTYMTMAFLQDPMYRYEGADDDDILGCMLLELKVRMDCINNKIPLAAHTVLRDSFAYGIGAAIPEWIRKRGKVPRVNKSLITSLLGSKRRRAITMEDALIYEGNGMSNIDPYMLLLDPSVSSADIQKGEFVGWVDRTNYMTLLGEEASPDSGLFNVKYLQFKKDVRSTLALDESDRNLRVDGSNELERSNQSVVNPVDRIRMYVNLIPKEWKLSKREYPEIWYFELASDDIVVRCEKATHNHGMYPIGLASPEYDGYSIAPIGRMEILYGLQHTLDFLFNSHISNVRKAINDMLVVDPFLVNIKDLEDPKPGKLIRLRRPAWGRGVEKVVQQLAVQDITRLNISDSAYITQWMDRIAGADQASSGVLRMSGPERLTSAEFQGTRGSAMNRMQRIGMIVGMEFFQDMATFAAVNTQQYMEEDTFVKAVGRYAELLQQKFGKDKRIRVKPEDLIVGYDILPRDGSIPGTFLDKWIEMFKIIGNNELLIQEYDTTKIFSYIATQMGVTNIDDFKRNMSRINPTVMGDEEVMREVERGNMIPASEVGGVQ